MSSQIKREREWEAAAGAGAPPAVSVEAKRPRTDDIASQRSFSGITGSGGAILTSQSLERPAQAHPMAALTAIRTKLLATGDPHLQARLLLQYSACAASPGAKTAAAIDFLFSFLQQNQNQTDTSAEAGAGAKPPADSSGSSGAIVVGAIVRGLRQLLAVKAAVVEPMIQVDAMGEQLMQCMSVGEDFKLRRDMMRIVVDCLMLTRRFTQVETLLHTCVQDHDAGMQAICLRGYLRLHDAGQRFVASATSSPEGQCEVTDYFDRLATFVLFAQSEEVRVLAARVLVALAELHPQLEIPGSSFFPSSLATTSTTSSPLLLPEKTFYVLCMAGNDASASVRVEIARCLRGFGRVPSSEVVEHAVVKTQIDEVVLDLPAEDVEMKTRRMMSSGMLLSLLDDADVEVAVEASRTIARLSELAMASDAGSGRWSQRALERAITAHLDVLPRAKTSVVASGSRNPRLRQVLVNSLHRLLVCRHQLDPKTDFAMANADLNGLIRGVAASPEDNKPAVVDTLLVLLHCDLSSASIVQRVVDLVLDTAAPASSDHIQADEDDEVEANGCWDTRLLAAVQTLITKCASALQMDVALMDRVRQEEARQRRGRRSLLGRVCRALLGSSEPHEDENEQARGQSDPSTGGSHLFFLTNQSAEEPCNTAVSSSQAVDSVKILRSPPADGDIAVYLKAVRHFDVVFDALRGH
ncbi:hypothetical protein BBJ28_00008882 [Nothophytophthora sp. Chile5]|nr:hypothetical protein BBJ28_00008882 [Nothophytophthora sp. Chile5]